MQKKGIEEKVLKAQRDEITEHIIYSRLSRRIKDPNNKKILKRIADDELRHYNFWKAHTQQEIRPDMLKAWRYLLIARIFGITFGIKLLEKGEGQAQTIYQQISEDIPGARDILRDEDEHERELINLIDEERLTYIGSMVLGLNDALVELTGALAGFTLALQNTRLIAMAGLITGIAASFSMAASEYLSTKSEGDRQNPLKASLYTGSAYIVTVLFLIFPFLLFSNLYLCLGLTIINAIAVIFVFTYYMSVARDTSFIKKFLEMASISLGVAALTFGIGFIIRIFLKVDI